MQSFTSAVFIQRLKQAQVILNIATKLDEWLCEVEIVLLKQPGFTVDIVAVKERLKELQVIMQFGVNAGIYPGLLGFLLRTLI